MPERKVPYQDACSEAPQDCGGTASALIPVGSSDPSTPRDFVLYDGDCPICRSYMSLAALRTVRPDIAMLDARSNPALVARLRSDGYDVNDSIIVRIARPDGPGELTLMGGDATRMIHDLGSTNGPTRRLALWVIGGAPWRHALYPYLRGTRNLLLRRVGRPLVP
ncbi:MAG: DUF393 domain-containing protein [Hyphomicrobiaceae bacterium]|nr:DUF393 domain-containing protein [Hyphomicrobiaceae bacterium]